MTEILDGPAVQVVQVALSRTTPYECRDGLDQETKLTLALPKCFFGLLAVLNVGPGNVPSLDSSLRIEQRIVANQEPAIIAVFPQRTVLTFELPRVSEGLSQHFAQSSHIVRVEPPGGKVVLLHILQCDTVVIQRGLIRRQYEPIGSRDRDERGGGVKGQAQIALARLQRLFGLLAIIDVRQEEIPGRDLTSRVPHGLSPDLEPPVDPVRAPAAVHTVIGLSGHEGLLPCLDHPRKIIRVDGSDEGPLQQFLPGPAEVLKGLAVGKLDLAHGAPRAHEPGNVVDDLPPGEFARTQGFLDALAILDINTGSVPFDDFP